MYTGVRYKSVKQSQPISCHYWRRERETNPCSDYSRSYKMRVSIAKLAAVIRHKQLIAMHRWLHASGQFSLEHKSRLLVVHPDRFWSTRQY